MSQKDVQKKGKSKKAYEVRSLRHEEKSAQSISSPSSHIEKLEKTWNRLLKEQEIAYKGIKHYEQVREQFIGRTDQFGS
jgi:hypothetical protein